LSDEVQRATPPDEEMTGYWERLPGSGTNAHLRNVEVAYSDEGGWQVTIWAREYFRDDQLGLELKRRIDSALLSVPGVTSAENGSWETWDVPGAPSGEALCRAAANVLDDLAPQMSAAYDEE
jgi:hypothetical protein